MWTRTITMLPCACARESEVDSELAGVKARLGRDREMVQKRIRENEQLRQDLNTGGKPGMPETQP